MRPLLLLGLTFTWCTSAIAGGPDSSFGHRPLSPAPTRQAPALPAQTASAPMPSPAVQPTAALPARPPVLRQAAPAAVVPVSPSPEPAALNPQPLPPKEAPSPSDGPPAASTRTGPGATGPAKADGLTPLKVSEHRLRITRTPSLASAVSEFAPSAAAAQVLRQRTDPPGGATGAGVRATIGRQALDLRRPDKQMFTNCKDAGLVPEITRIGAITPGQQFVIDGFCLGERTGEVILKGLPGGDLQLTFSQWKDDRVVAMLSAGRVRGAVDQKVEVHLVTQARERAGPRLARFVAERVLVRVPPQRWTPHGIAEWNFLMGPDSDPPLRAFPGATFLGTGPLPELPSRFTARLPAGCEMATAGISGSGFRVLSPLDWDPAAPAEEPAIRVGLQHETTGRFSRSYNYVIGSGGQDLWLGFRGRFDIGGEAWCPVGVTL